MSKDFCMDCGMLLSPHTSICSVCGFDNTLDGFSDIALDIDQLLETNDDFISENHLGFQQRPDLISCVPSKKVQIEGTKNAFKSKIALLINFQAGID